MRDKCSEINTYFLTLFSVSHTYRTHIRRFRKLHWSIEMVYVHLVYNTWTWLNYYYFLLIFLLKRRRYKHNQIVLFMDINYTMFEVMFASLPHVPMSGQVRSGQVRSGHDPQIFNPVHVPDNLERNVQKPVYIFERLLREPWHNFRERP